jgi:hypothetical protein
MQTGRRGFFGMIAAALGGGVAAAAISAQPPSLFKGLAAKVAPLRAIPWKTGTQGEAMRFAGIGDDPAGLVGPQRDYTAGTRALFEDPKAARAAQIEREIRMQEYERRYDNRVAKAVNRALLSGQANGLRETLKNL